MSGLSKLTLPSTNGQNNRPTVPHVDLPGWFLMMDDERLRDPGKAIPHLPSSSAIIIRSRQMDVVERTAIGLQPLAERHGVELLVSLRRPPARLISDGIHIPEAYLKYWRRTDIARLQPRLLTVSAHRRRTFRKAASLGADAVIMSSVFSTESHKGVGFLGFTRFARLAALSETPVIALGGITDRNMQRLRMVNIAGIAGIGLFLKQQANIAR